MPLDPSQLVTATATGLVLGAAKVIDFFSKRTRRKRAERQMDHIEAKADLLVEDMREVNHRLARLEGLAGFSSGEWRNIRSLRNGGDE